MKKLLNLKLDYKLVIPVIILGIFSLATLKNIGPLVDARISYISFYNKQSFGFIIGIIGIIFIYNINLKKFVNLINITYFILVGMLFILAFDPPIIGDLFLKNTNGANGWFKIISPKLSFQPVEFFKVLLILKLALISEQYLKSNEKDDWLIKKYFLYGALPIGLVLIEPDLGGTMLLSFAFTVMLITSLKNKKMFKLFLYFLLGALVFIILLIFSDTFSTIVVNLTPLRSYQLSRIDAWLNPFSTEKGYQLSQSLIFMGSAGPFGHGAGFNQISLSEAQTDLIFTAFVGFFGWVLGLIVIFLYGVIINQSFTIALLQKNFFFKFTALGFSSLFFIQVTENIGMLIGLLPITGIVLPFMSYGLSALLTYSAIIGILINISKETDFDPNKYNK